MAAERIAVEMLVAVVEVVERRTSAERATDDAASELALVAAVACSSVAVVVGPVVRLDRRGTLV